MIKIIQLIKRRIKFYKNYKKLKLLLPAGCSKGYAYGLDCPMLDKYNYKIKPYAKFSIDTNQNNKLIFSVDNEEK